jgi:glutamate-ammonia-ligase adenylyltransferase
VDEINETNKINEINDINELIKTAAEATADPGRSLKNLERLFYKHPDIAPDLAQSQKVESTAETELFAVAKLFANSQFLADFCVNNPQVLIETLENLSAKISIDEIVSKAQKSPLYNTGDINYSSQAYKSDAMKYLRSLKKRYLLHVTLRDICGITGPFECMEELSTLGIALTRIALDFAKIMTEKRFGTLIDNQISVIALGKLGAGELNYSSDIDIIVVFSSNDGTSSGTESTSGIYMNRIDPQEYFGRLTEQLASLLQTQTEDGIAYRVDLRLRPDGRKSPLALPLQSYATYYEAWGKTLERMALIRARPIAGDAELGEEFMRVIEPFVWKKSTDYYDIDEIRELKNKIDKVFDADDIKRGYGGIREVEFFVQTFQLLYGGLNHSLRATGLKNILSTLQSEGFLNDQDINVLQDSYIFLRKLEHFIQMKDDRQAHTIPAQPEEVEALARKMGFANSEEFYSELKLKRLKVRDMYNSLLGGPGSKPEASVFLEGELKDREIVDYLSFKGFLDTAQALQSIKAIKDQISLGKTIRERTLLNRTVPMFLEEILKVANKDRSLSLFATLISKIGGFESYMDLFSKHPAIIELVVKVFNESTYLSRAMLSLDNLESIFEYPDVSMDRRSLNKRLNESLKLSADIKMDIKNVVREYKSVEELKIGTMFLTNQIDIDVFSSKLSLLADTIVKTVLKELNGLDELAVVGLGRMGAAEMNIGSDLDLIFVSEKTSIKNKKAVEIASEIIKVLSEFTSKGVAYQLDMRLRPDGSKGILVNDIKGYRNYYLKVAHPWEIQALLRARTIAGKPELLRSFNAMRREVIKKRGREVTAEYIKDMRNRILKGIAKESAGYDIKRGPGGLEEIQFMVQYLQLQGAGKYSSLITHRTSCALRQLTKCDKIDKALAGRVLQASRFLRTVEAIVRLNEEKVLKKDSDLTGPIAEFFGYAKPEDLLGEIDKARVDMLAAAGKIYG